MRKTILILLTLISVLSAGGKGKVTKSESKSTEIITGAEQLDAYLTILKDKKVGLMANQVFIRWL